MDSLSGAAPVTGGSLHPSAGTAAPVAGAAASAPLEAAAAGATAPAPRPTPAGLLSAVCQPGGYVVTQNFTTNWRVGGTGEGSGPFSSDLPALAGCMCGTRFVQGEVDFRPAINRKALAAGRDWDDKLRKNFGVVHFSRTAQAGARNEPTPAQGAGVPAAITTYAPEVHGARLLSFGERIAVMIYPETIVAYAYEHVPEELILRHLRLGLVLVRLVTGQEVLPVKEPAITGMVLQASLPLLKEAINRDPLWMHKAAALLPDVVVYCPEVAGQLLVKLKAPPSSRGGGGEGAGAGGSSGSGGGGGGAASGSSGTKPGGATSASSAAPAPPPSSPVALIQDGAEGNMILSLGRGYASRAGATEVLKQLVDLFFFPGSPLLPSP